MSKCILHTALTHVLVWGSTIDMSCCLLSLHTGMRLRPMARPLLPHT